MFDFFEKDAFGLFSIYLSTITAVLSIIWSIVTAVSRDRETESTIAEVEELVFESVLRSDQLDIVKSYLNDKLGNISIAEYVDNKKVNERVNTILLRLIEFLGKSDEIEHESKIKPPHLVPQGLVTNPELKSVYHELNNGETWNALARLRRYIEIALREIAMTQDANVDNTRSANQLLRFLTTRDLINPAAVKYLEYAIAVANTSIHGFPTSYEEAKEAIDSAEHGLSILLHPIE